jgi:hypothetical protein
VATKAEARVAIRGVTTINNNNTNNNNTILITVNKDRGKASSTSRSTSSSFISTSSILNINNINRHSPITLRITINSNNSSMVVNMVITMITTSSTMRILTSSCWKKLREKWEEVESLFHSNSNSILKLPPQSHPPAICPTGLCLQSMVNSPRMPLNFGFRNAGIVSAVLDTSMGASAVLVV